MCWPAHRAYGPPCRLVRPHGVTISLHGRKIATATWRQQEPDKGMKPVWLSVLCLQMNRVHMKTASSNAFTIAVLDTRHHDRWHTSSIVGLSTALNRPTTRDESAAVFTVSPVVAIKNLRGHNIRHSRFLSVTTRPTAEELIFQEAFNLPQDISFMECFLKRCDLSLAPLTGAHKSLRSNPVSR